MNAEERTIKYGEDKNELMVVVNSFQVPEVNNKDDYSDAADVITRIKGAIIKINKKRLSKTRPLDDLKSDIKGFYDTYIDLLKECSNQIEKKMTGWRKIEQEKIRIEQEEENRKRRIKAEQERERLFKEAEDIKKKAEEAKKNGNQEEATKNEIEIKEKLNDIDNVEILPAKIDREIPKVKGISHRKDIIITIIDPTKVPEEYYLADEEVEVFIERLEEKRYIPAIYKLINARIIDLDKIKSGYKHTKHIPEGVSIKEEESMIVKGKRS